MAGTFIEQITESSQTFYGWIEMLSYIKHNSKFMFDNLTKAP
jgi:hypothetical protein